MCSEYIVVGYNKDSKTITVVDRLTLKTMKLKYNEQIHGGIVNETTGKVIQTGLSIGCYFADRDKKLYTILDKFDGNTTEFDLSDTEGNVRHMSLTEIIEEGLELTNGRYEKVGFETIILPKAI